MKHLAIIPGDGIGKEVIAAGMEVLEAVSEISSFQFDPEYVDIGSDRYLATGELLTDEDIDLLKSKDAIYFGAIGDPRVAPGILEQGILLKMRAVFDQYINLRPVTSWFPLVPSRGRWISISTSSGRTPRTSTWVPMGTSDPVMEAERPVYTWRGNCTSST